MPLNTYQVGTDELLVIVSQQNPVNKLTTDQVRGIFTGRIQTWEAVNGADSLTHVWVFPPGEDIQKIFDQNVLGGNPLTSQARLSSGPDEMLNSVSNDVNAIGILTGHLKTENFHSAYIAATKLPVLATTRAEPSGALVEILACIHR
jgi:phosphate transport system substrate-binding protein